MDEFEQDAMQNMAKIAEETCAIGAATLQTLEEQGEKLRRVDNRLNAMDASLTQSEKHLTKLESFWNFFSFRWKPTKKPNSQPVELLPEPQVRTCEDELGRAVQVLKQQAVAMGNELSIQNATIDRITDRTATAQKRVAAASKRVTNLL